MRICAKSSKVSSEYGFSLNVIYVCSCKSIPNTADDKIKEVQQEVGRRVEKVLWIRAASLAGVQQSVAFIPFPMECYKVAIRRLIPIATDNVAERGLHRADRRTGDGYPWESPNEVCRQGVNLARKWRLSLTLFLLFPDKVNPC